MLEGAMYLGSNPQKTIQFFSPIVINNQEVKMRLLILGLLFSAACSAPIVHINPENGESIEFWLNDGGTVEKKAEILADGTLKVDAVETLAGGTPTLGGNALGALAQEDTVGASEIDTDAVGSDEIAEGAVAASELALDSVVGGEGGDIKDNSITDHDLAANSCGNSELIASPSFTSITLGSDATDGRINFTSDSNTYIHHSAGDQIRYYAGGYERFRISEGIYMPVISTGAQTRTLCTNDSSGLVSRNSGACGTSTLASKNNVVTLKDELNVGAIIDGLRPVVFTYNDQPSDFHTRQIGLIVEETDLILPHISDKNDAGGLENIQYDKLVALLLAELQLLRERVATLEAAP